MAAARARPVYVAGRPQTKKLPEKAQPAWTRHHVVYVGGWKYHLSDISSCTPGEYIREEVDPERGRPLSATEVGRTAKTDEQIDTLAKYIHEHVHGNANLSTNNCQNWADRLLEAICEDRYQPQGLRTRHVTYAVAVVVLAVLISLLVCYPPPLSEWIHSWMPPQDAESQFQLGFRSEHGKGVDSNMHLAFQAYTVAARQGHAKAQYRLGLLYASGMGTKRDPVSAETWFEKAARQGESDGQYALGLSIFKGEGRKPSDPALAVSWLQKAARQDHVLAMALLGRVLLTESVKNETEAIEWLRRAVASHSVPAAYEDLCGLYAGGVHLGVSDAIAVKWCSLAADAGHGNAAYHLGRLFYNGKAGVIEQDYVKAVKYFEEAEAKGLCAARQELAKCYILGQGVQVDRAKAHKLLSCN